MKTFAILKGDLQAWGIIPSFLDPVDPRPAREQIDQNYISGWQSFRRFTFDPKTLELKYPGDKAMRPIGVILFGDEQLLLYRSAWVVILQPDGTWDCSRLD